VKALDGVDLAGANGFALRLEREGLIVLPGQPFTLDPAERDLVSPRHSDGRAKNISLGPFDAVRGAAPDPQGRNRLAALMGRYRAWAETTLGALAPGYAPSLERGRTSLRTREAAEGASSPRKDDRRLHVDAFASQPTGGRRILRVFTNINPAGEARHWRVGEPFEAYAARWLRRVRRPFPGESLALRTLGITRDLRTPYDWLMLGLHDAAKLDEAYQRTAPRREAAFPAGASWIVFTDSVVHAATSGRFLLEQTFYLPIAAMAAPDLAPARVLERMTGRRLV
jgi:hypothetical protein